MAISTIVWFVLLQGVILTIGSSIFVGIMIKNYSKKKTMGTALLAIVYAFLAIRQAVGVAFNTYAAVDSLAPAHNALLLAYLMAFVLLYYFLYLFGSRHILHDNDVVRGLISVFYLTVNTAAVAFIGYEMFGGVENPIFYAPSTEPGTLLTSPMPTLLISAMLYGIILVLVQIRYIFSISMSLIRQKSIDPMRRIGTKYILAAVITLFLDVMLTVVFTVEGLSALIVIFLYLSRFILTALSLFLSYIGWILPDWFRKRMRQKAWIAKELSNVKKPTATFVTSSSYYGKSE